jgi:hypothetical protein
MDTPNAYTNFVKYLNSNTGKDVCDGLGMFQDFIETSFDLENTLVKAIVSDYKELILYFNENQEGANFHENVICFFDSSLQKGCDIRSFFKQYKH